MRNLGKLPGEKKAQTAAAAEASWLVLVILGLHVSQFTPGTEVPDT